jgi:hypothetical protein
LSILENRIHDSSIFYCLWRRLTSQDVNRFSSAGMIRFRFKGMISVLSKRKSAKDTPNRISKIKGFERLFQV